MLELRQAKKVYRTGDVSNQVLSDLNLRIERGEMVAIVGPSGSGKSTLLNILGCLDTVTAGEYLVNGQSVAGLGAAGLARLRNRTFGFVFQFFGLISEYSALENVMIPLIYRGVSMGTARSRASRVLDELGIGALRAKLPVQMSGGQQQRVAVARALVGDPPIILADEPTGSLDSASGSLVLEMLAERNRQGKTVLMVTHSTEVSQRCPRVIQVRDGRITQRSQ